MASVIQPKRALEIGTFTGYSALCIARGLPENATLTCLDKSGEWTNIAQKYWQRANVEKRIELRLGDAHETLPTLLKEDGAPFDFIFIDADKTGYDSYFEMLLPHLPPNGLIIFDNMLRDGRVAHPPLQSEDDIAIDALNQKLAHDSRTDCVLLAVADGLMMCRVK